MDDKSLRAYLAELIGTFALVFVSAAAVYVDLLQKFQVGAAGIALATALIYAGALAFTLPLSGGYLNPAITIMLYVFKKLDGARTLGLIFVQVLGATLAGAALSALFSMPEGFLVKSHVGAPQYNTQAFGYGDGGSVFVPLLKGIGLELLLTLMVAFAIFALFFDPRVPRLGSGWAGRLAYLWVGLIAGAVTLVGLPLTGGAINPARWLGLALWDRIQNGPEAFNYNSVHWVGPIAGALLGGWLYSALVLPPEEETQLSQPASSTTAASVPSTLFRARK
jgi:glycerol uptake facilitator-like aquaporin